jgi:uncharacterized protein with HEPN domain
VTRRVDDLLAWREVKGMRIIAAHAYLAIEYETAWVTLSDDVPRIGEAMASRTHSPSRSSPQPLILVRIQASRFSRI